MENLEKKPDTTLAALAHISTFGQFILPFGNFVFPLIIGAIKKEDEFVNANVKQALNFQMSLFLYSILIIGVASACFFFIIAGNFTEFPFNGDEFYLHDLMFPVNMFLILIPAGVLLLGVCILNLIAVIIAAIRASEGNAYKYPLAIQFLRSSYQSNNEEFNNNNNTKRETL